MPLSSIKVDPSFEFITLPLTQEQIEQLPRELRASRSTQGGDEFWVLSAASLANLPLGAERGPVHPDVLPPSELT